ncbi:FISUMP domain-containing protein [Bacteroidota bacterium]
MKKILLIILPLTLLFACNKDDNMLIAAFSSDQTEVNQGQIVQFSDQSSNSPTSWSWDFGDGRTSTSQNPTHSYFSTGSHNVSLTATNSYGSDTESKTNYITVISVGWETGTVNDYDENTYNTIKIGDQWWMAENLKTSHYANGTEIQLVENTNDWDNLGYTDKAYCYYDNSSMNAYTYGALYKWAAVMNGAASSDNNPSEVQGVCPSGWHLPSDEEWKELEIYLGMDPDEADDYGYRGTNEGSKLAGNSDLWEDVFLENEAAFGTSGFTALPGGGRHYDGSFYNLGSTARFWSATELDASSAWYRRLLYATATTGVSRYYDSKNIGYSVRCVKD